MWTSILTWTREEDYNCYWCEFKLKASTTGCENCWEILADSVDDVVDLQDAPDRLAGEGDGAGADQQGLDHVLLQDVGDGALPHVDPGSLLTLGVFVPQLGDGACKIYHNKTVGLHIWLMATGVLFNKEKYFKLQIAVEN